MVVVVGAMIVGIEAVNQNVIIETEETTEHPQENHFEAMKEVVVWRDGTKIRFGVGEHLLQIEVGRLVMQHEMLEILQFQI